MTSALALTCASVTAVPYASQLFHPIGGVGARAALCAGVTDCACTTDCARATPATPRGADGGVDGRHAPAELTRRRIGRWVGIWRRYVACRCRGGT